MANWQDLTQELDEWQDINKVATLWWRDDDACILTPELKQLIGIADKAGVPIHLAVIPARLEADAATYLMQSPNTRILQHGFSHTDHAPKGEGSWELGDHRALETVSGELSQGFEILQTAFGEKFLPVLVPPWTRFSEKLRPILAPLGFKGYSAEGFRPVQNNENDIKIIHAHCDPIKWKQGGRFKGTERVLDDFVEHLRQRRLGKCDPSEPTGLCTHHMDHTRELWDFLPKLLQATNTHPAVKWISIEGELK